MTTNPDALQVRSRAVDELAAIPARPGYCEYLRFIRLGAWNDLTKAFSTRTRFGSRTF